MNKYWKKIFVVCILLSTMTIASAADPDCLKVGVDGNCLICNNGKVAFNGKCTDSILHCL